MPDQPQQEQPGPEWFLDGADFYHPILAQRVGIMGELPDGKMVMYAVDQHGNPAFGGIKRYAWAEAVARCRQISAAALAWERMKLELTCCPLCGANSREAHAVICPTTRTPMPDNPQPPLTFRAWAALDASGKEDTACHTRMFIEKGTAARALAALEALAARLESATVLHGQTGVLVSSDTVAAYKFCASQIRSLLDTANLRAPHE